MIKRVLLIAALVALLVGCGGKAHFATFKAYRGKSSVQIFNEAEMHLAKGKYQKAINDLQALDALFPFGPYAQQGQLDVIYAYYKNADDPSAAVAADRYIRLYPRGKNVDYAYYMKGLISYQQGQTWMQKKLHIDPAQRDLAQKKTGYLALQSLVMTFPHSRYAANATYHMMQIRNIIAKKQVDVAQFYMKREAYVAAANRASYVVAHFPRSPQVIPALDILVKSYRAMGLTALANNTLKVFQASYPSSPLLSDLTKTA